MTVLILGITTFFGIHLVPSLPLREVIVDRFGVDKYKLVFSVISLGGLGLIIYGFQLAVFVPLWNPAPWGRTATIAIMPIVCVLMCAADVPNNIKRFIRHPMLMGLTLWGAAHLTANGDLASTLIFASFAIFSVLDIVLVEVMGRYTDREAVSYRWDIGVVAAGIALYGLLFYFHESFTGAPLL